MTIPFGFVHKSWPLSTCSYYIYILLDCISNILIVLEAWSSQPLYCVYIIKYINLILTYDMNWYHYDISYWKFRVLPHPFFSIVSSISCMLIIFWYLLDILMEEEKVCLVGIGDWWYISFWYSIVVYGSHNSCCISL